jgi:CheY-like chemotaxis protein
MDRPAPVLVVDDDRDFRDAVAAVLERQGYEVRCAANGAQALALMHRGKPGAIVLDLSMPVMSGWELIDALRADGDLACIPVVVLSATRAPAGVIQLAKPVSLHDLVTTVDRVCGR